MKINLKQEQNCLLQQHTPNVEEAELCLPRLLAVQEDMGLLMQQLDVVLKDHTLTEACLRGASCSLSFSQPSHLSPPFGECSQSCYSALFP